jgi:SAM-dependent methyltransferase
MRWTSTPHDVYVRHRDYKARVFCERFPNGIDFSGKTVLEVGCGHGSLCFYAAQEGAKRVHGIDLSARRIELAERRLAQDFNQYLNLIEFVCEEIGNLRVHDFDIILSQSTFEHILDPEVVLSHMRAKLALGGKIYLGIGPLYKSPWGDHRHTEVPFQPFFPWAHLIFPESWIIRHLNNKYPQRPISSLDELGLNRYSLHQYIEMFEVIDLNLTFCEVNRTESPIGRMLNILRRLPGLEEYLSVNLHCILERRSK